MEVLNFRSYNAKSGRSFGGICFFSGLAVMFLFLSFQTCSCELVRGMKITDKEKDELRSSMVTAGINKKYIEPFVKSIVEQIEKKPVLPGENVESKKQRNWKQQPKKSLNEKDFFSGAVVEYGPISLPNSGALDKVLANADEYQNAISKIHDYSTNGLDIVVFPEGGLGTKINNTSHYAENVQPMSNPCQLNKTDTPLLNKLSCIAANQSVYMVVNLVEKNDTILYNTNVVFDRNGTIIARYRKWNVYGSEDGISKPPSVDHTYFDTDFGVRFGTFTCFDISFKTPAMELESLYNTTHYVYPAAWFSDLPFKTALQEQSWWAGVTGGVLMAANRNDPLKGESGSGIYFGSQSSQLIIDSSQMAQVKGNFAIIGRIPKVLSKKQGGYDYFYADIMPLYNNSSVTQSPLKINKEEVALKYAKTEVLPAGTEGSSYNITTVSSGKITVVIVQREIPEKNLCENGLCCHFQLAAGSLFIPSEYAGQLISPNSRESSAATGTE